MSTLAVVVRRKGRGTHSLRQVILPTHLGVKAVSRVRYSVDNKTPRKSFKVFSVLCDGAVFLPFLRKNN